MKGYIKFSSLYQIWLIFVTDSLKSSVNVYTASFDIRTLLFFTQFNTILTSTVCLCVQHYIWVFLTGTSFYLCALRNCSQKHTFIVRSLMTISNTSLPPRQAASKRSFPSDFQMISPYILSPLYVQVFQFTFCYICFDYLNNDIV